MKDKQIQPNKVGPVKLVVILKDLLHLNSDVKPMQCCLREHTYTLSKPRLSRHRNMFYHYLH